MKVRGKSALILTLLAIPASLLGCGSKKSNANSDGTLQSPISTGAGSDDSLDSVEFSGNVGSLTLGLNLLANDYDIVRFKLKDGQLASSLPMEVIALDDDGSFTSKLPKLGEGIDPELAPYMGSDGKIDRAKVLAEHPGAEAEIASMSEEELIEQLKRDGGRASDVSYALVLRNKTVDAVDKMASLEKFIGISAGNGALLGMRPDDMKSGERVELGAIGTNGLAATSLSDIASVFADSSSVAAAEEIARTNTALQGLANVYANTNKESGSSWEFTPFFSFQGDAAGVKDAFGSPSDFAYQNMGVYVSVDDEQNLVFEDVCGPAKGLLQLVPPQPAVYNGVTISANNPISNVHVGAITERSTSHSTTSECSTESESAGMLFVRQFSTEGKRFLFNTTVDGTPPKGVWKVKLDGTQLAQFNMSPAAPLDADGNPKIYIPSLKIVTDNAGLITEVRIKFYVYEKGQYIAVNDLKGFNKVVTQVTYSFSDNNGKASSPTSIETNSAMKIPADGSEFVADQMEHSFLFPDQADDQSQYRAGVINVSYDMYGNRYRFDFRLNQ